MKMLSGLKCFFIGVFAILFFVGNSVAKDNSESSHEPVCAKYHSHILAKDVAFCVDRSRPDLPARLGESVAYFMHGTNGGAKTWVKNKYFHSLSVLRGAGSLPSVTFVSFDTSAYSFFTDHPIKPGSTDTSKAYETWFITEFMPYIETTFGVCDRRDCRGLIGESMGGFGALKTGLRHPDLFSVVSVNDPALSPFEDNQPFDTWVKYFETKPVGALKGALVAKIFLDIFPDDLTFKSHDPTHLVRNYNSLYKFPALYFDMGGKDSYGFYDGYVLLKDALDKRGFVYSTFFDPKAGHDMWTKHSVDSLKFLMANIH